MVLFVIISRLLITTAVLTVNEVVSIVSKPVPSIALTKRVCFPEFKLDPSRALKAFSKSVLLLNSDQLLLSNL